MKFNKMLIVLALCAAMQPGISFSSAVPQSQSYYQQYAPQFMQDTTGYISKQARSAYDTVNSWSTQKKVAVASAIITALAAVYNRDQIMQWVADLLPLSQVDILQIQKLEKSLKPVMQDRDQARIVAENLKLAMDFGANGNEAIKKLQAARADFLEQDQKMWDILKAIEIISPQEEKKVYDQLRKYYENPFAGAL